MKRIVVATDGSTAATAALEEAIAIAQSTGDQLAAITVWRALQGDFGLAYPSGALLNELLDAERGHAEASLEDAISRARAAGVAVTTRLATGDPAECICAYAEEIDARMIAMGSHGYGTVASFLLGSVSGEVLRKASCPVLVVRERTERSEQSSHAHVAAGR
jgi:nucleotide-binding universal stress UspA family protein